MVLSITQDHDVTPCGAGSSTNAAIRRITLAQGVLVEEELAIACPTPSGGLIITGTYHVDGASSTGLFAGARGKVPSPPTQRSTRQTCPASYSSPGPRTEVLCLLRVESCCCHQLVVAPMWNHLGADRASLNRKLEGSAS